MKKITWLTEDCFVDCDINIIPLLSNKFKIFWIIILTKDARYKDSDFDCLKKEFGNLTISIIHINKRIRNPLTLNTYIKIVNLIKYQKSNINYINIATVSPWGIPLFIFLPSRSTILTAHQGAVHAGMRNKIISKLLRKFIYNRFRLVNMFSKSQAKLFQKQFPKSKIFQFFLTPKYFGEPNIMKEEDGIVHFLSFGIINYAKHIDLLIKAACNIYEKGYKNIRITIAGMCANWQPYEDLIRYPEIFDLKIKKIDNADIPNLFHSADYFVQPYRIVTQSGPFKIAMTYNVPIITSNLPGFTDEMVDGVTGYIFENDNLAALESVMEKAIEIKLNHNNYTKLKDSLRSYVSDNYSLNIMAKHYESMFNQIL